MSGPSPVGEAGRSVLRGCTVKRYACASAGGRSRSVACVPAVRATAGCVSLR